MLFFTWVISYPCESSTISLFAFNSLKTREIINIKKNAKDDSFLVFVSLFLWAT